MIQKSFIYIFLLCSAVILFTALSLFNAPEFIQTIYNIPFLLLFPGFLIYLNHNKKIDSLSETLVFSVGLSLCFLLIGGIIINTAFFLLRLPNPLSNIYLVAFFNIIFIFLIIGAFNRTKEFNFSLPHPPFSLLHSVFTFIPFIFVALSIFGAISLNNGSTNIFTLLMLGLIGAYIVITATIFGKDDFDFTLPIYCMSLSLLLMLSLRSNFVTGWDIQEEFIKFSQTLAVRQWSNVIDNSPYNSCLSITILPTILTQFIRIPHEYIFKFVFQVIFAFMPVTVYILARQYVSRKTAFLGSVYLIAQPFFIQPMTSLMRQEIAFVLFALILLVLFHKSFTGISKNILLVLLVVSMVLSHYSTSYLSILLFTLTYIFFLIYRLLIRVEKIRNLFLTLRLFSGQRYHFPTMVSLPFLVLLIATTFMWYTVINKSPDNLYTITIETVNNFSQIFRKKPANEEANKSLNLYSKVQYNTVQLIEQFIKANEIKYRSYYLNHYEPNTYEDFKIIAVSPKQVVPLIATPFNKQIVHVFELSKQLTKALIFIGGAYILLFIFRKDTFKKEYLVVGFTSLLIISAVVFHPTLSARYNISRAYLQLLTVLSLFAVFGSFALTFFMPKRVQIVITALLFSGVLLYHHGFIGQFFGGPAYMHLNNYGEDYDKFYVHATEMSAGQWLKKNSEPVAPIFADRESNLRLYKTQNKYALPVIFPQFIQIESYVFARYANVIENRAVINYQGKDLLYQYPFEFLNENKNLIYSSKSSLIYE